MNKDTFLTVRLTAEDYANLKALATDEEVTVSRLIRQKVQEMFVQGEVCEWE